MLAITLFCLALEQQFVIGELAAAGVVAAPAVPRRRNDLADGRLIWQVRTFLEFFKELEEAGRGNVFRLWLRLLFRA